MKKFQGIPIKFSPAVPDGHVMVNGRRPSGPGTLDPMEEYGAVLRPDGSIVEYVIRDGRVIVR
jgi:hypothetical protein